MNTKASKIEVKFHHWGCNWCAKEYPKGLADWHLKGTYANFSNPDGPMFEVVCNGSFKPTVEWYQKTYSYGVSESFLRKASAIKWAKKMGLPSIEA